MSKPARKGKNSPMQQPVNQGANTENINGSPALTRNRRLGQLETEHKNHLEQIESLKKDLETLRGVHRQQSEDMKRVEEEHEKTLKQQQMQLGVEAAKARVEIGNLRQKVDESQALLSLLRASLAEKEADCALHSKRNERSLKTVLDEITELRAANAALKAQVENTKRKSLNIAAACMELIEPEMLPRKQPSPEGKVTRFQVAALNAVESLTSALLRTVLDDSEPSKEVIQTLV